jgi:hypothetical protein
MKKRINNIIIMNLCILKLWAHMFNHYFIKLLYINAKSESRIPLEVKHHDMNEFLWEPYKETENWNIEHSSTVMLTTDISLCTCSCKYLEHLLILWRILYPVVAFDLFLNPLEYEINYNYNYWVHIVWVQTMKSFFTVHTPITSPNRTANAGKVHPMAVAARQPTIMCSHSGLLKPKIRLSAASYCSSSA